MKKYNFDCVEFNGYTGNCNLKGGQCVRVCKDWKDEKLWAEMLNEQYATITLAKLRKILTNHTDRLGTIHSSVELLMKTIKQNLPKR